MMCQRVVHKSYQGHKPSSGNSREVGLGDPRVPVPLKCSLRDGSALVLAERVLIDNITIASCVEKTWRDPRL